MSQLLRYTPSLKPGLMIEDAEGKWAKYEVLAQLVAQVGALQQRLTAADERADVLETALKKISVRCVAYIEAEREMPEPSVEVCQTIAEAALKPAEGGGDE
ncbi:hypothetical protein EJJ20_29945 [Pseudomonas poae]|nr:hypothetical protein EJJ20_29945 [Pseudomonas poae]